MAAKQLVFREDARRALKRGVDQLAEAVSPPGRAGSALIRRSPLTC
jgi:hypothetical protein